MSDIPENMLDLFQKPVICVLATVLPDGQPQVHPVWCDYDGKYIRINTVRGRQKDLNMQHTAKVTTLLIDPEDDGRWIEIRGHVAESTEEGSVEDINQLARKYTGKAFRPLKPGEVRVIYKIAPDKITLGDS